VRGLWGNFWTRAILTLAIALVACVLASFLPILMNGAYEYGVLDFAGGSIIGVNWPLPFGFSAAIWSMFEWVGWRKGNIPPLGSILLFIVVFLIALNLLASGASVFVSAKGAALFWTFMAVPSAVIALIPAVAYALMSKKRRLLKAPEIF